MLKPLRLLPGFKFTPSDSDLIQHYLKKKINGEALPVANLIKDRDLYGKETPFMIYETCSSSSDSSVFNNWMYFFTKIKKKFTGGKRIDRIVGNGSWKISNTTKVYDENNKNLVIGYKTLLNFIVKLPEKENKQQPNSWILYEYTLKGSSDAIDNDSIWAVCKFRKGGKLRKHSHSHDDNPPPSLKRERPASAVTEDDDDDDENCYAPEKKRACYRSSSSAFKYDEGLLVERQQQCVTDQHNVDDWLCVSTDDECQSEIALISSSYSLNSETDQQQYTGDNTLFCNPSGDDCNTASTSYPLSPLTTLDDLPSFYEYNSQQPYQIGADNNAITSSCWNECETTSTPCVSRGAPTQTLTGVSIPDDAESSLAAHLDDQCAYSTVNEEKIWSPEDWKELELMLFSGIESL